MGLPINERKGFYEAPNGPVGDPPSPTPTRPLAEIYASLPQNTPFENHTQLSELTPGEWKTALTEWQQTPEGRHVLATYIDAIPLKDAEVQPDAIRFIRSTFTDTRLPIHLRIRTSATVVREAAEGTGFLVTDELTGIEIVSEATELLSKMDREIFSKYRKKPPATVRNQAPAMGYALELARVGLEDSAFRQLCPNAATLLSTWNEKTIDPSTKNNPALLKECWTMAKAIVENKDFDTRTWEDILHEWVYMDGLVGNYNQVRYQALPLKQPTPQHPLLGQPRPNEYKLASTHFNFATVIDDTLALIATTPNKELRESVVAFLRSVHDKEPLILDQLATAVTHSRLHPTSNFPRLILELTHNGLGIQLPTNLDELTRVATTEPESQVQVVQVPRKVAPGRKPELRLTVNYQDSEDYTVNVSGQYPEESFPHITPYGSFRSAELFAQYLQIEDQQIPLATIEAEVRKRLEGGNLSPEDFPTVVGQFFVSLERYLVNHYPLTEQSTALVRQILLETDILTNPHRLPYAIGIFHFITSENFDEAMNRHVQESMNHLSATNPFYDIFFAAKVRDFEGYHLRSGGSVGLEETALKDLHHIRESGIFAEVDFEKYLALRTIEAYSRNTIHWLRNTADLSLDFPREFDEFYDEVKKTIAQYEEKLKAEGSSIAFIKKLQDDWDKFTLGMRTTLAEYAFMENNFFQKYLEEFKEKVAQEDSGAINFLLGDFLNWFVPDGDTKEYPHLDDAGFLLHAIFGAENVDPLYKHELLTLIIQKLGLVDNMEDILNMSEFLSRLSPLHHIAYVDDRIVIAQYDGTPIAFPGPLDGNLPIIGELQIARGDDERLLPRRRIEKAMEQIMQQIEENPEEYKWFVNMTETERDEYLLNILAGTNRGLPSFDPHFTYPKFELFHESHRADKQPNYPYVEFYKTQDHTFAGRIILSPTLTNAATLPITFYIDLEQGLVTDLRKMISVEAFSILERTILHHLTLEVANPTHLIRRSNRKNGLAPSRMETPTNNRESTADDDTAFQQLLELYRNGPAEIRWETDEAIYIAVNGTKIDPRNNQIVFMWNIGSNEQVDQLYWDSPFDIYNPEEIHAIINETGKRVVYLMRPVNDDLNEGEVIPDKKKRLEEVTRRDGYRKRRSAEMMMTESNRHPHQPSLLRAAESGILLKKIFMFTPDANAPDGLSVRVTYSSFQPEAWYPEKRGKRLDDNPDLTTDEIAEE